MLPTRLSTAARQRPLLPSPSSGAGEERLSRTYAGFPCTSHMSSGGQEDANASIRPLFVTPLPELDEGPVVRAVGGIRFA